tara:strand:+ start:4029 stop:4766 length:738 start_codon:yes stop_codon:yes gene_type:complete
MLTTAVILAAGLGSRLDKSITTGPKGFIELNGEKIILRSIRLLQRNGIEKIFIGTGHLSHFYDDICDNEKIICIKNSSYKTTGSFYTLCNLINNIDHDFLLLESDIFFEEKTIKVLKNIDKTDVIIVSSFTKSGDEVFVDVDSDFHLKSLSKKKSLFESPYGELVGISKISKKTLDYLKIWYQKNKQISKSIHYEQAFSLMSDNIDFYVEKIEDLIWTEIDTKEHYFKAKNIIAPKIKKNDHEDG